VALVVFSAEMGRPGLAVAGKSDFLGAQMRAKDNVT
jgi:hypothetical protein